MALSLKSISREVVEQAPRIILYGPQKCGKTTFAAGMPNPVFVFTEPGLYDKNLDVAFFRPDEEANPNAYVFESFTDVMDALRVLYAEKHDFKTLVIDTVDHFERLVYARTCEVNGWHSIEDKKFGAGYDAALEIWREFTTGLDRLRGDRGMTICLLAHAHTRKVSNPGQETYDRWTLRMREKTAEYLRDWSDLIWFANYSRYVSTEDKGFGQKRNIAMGDDEVKLHTRDNAAYSAGGRVKLPATLPLEWSAVAPYLEGKAEEADAE